MQPRHGQDQWETPHKDDRYSPNSLNMFCPEDGHKKASLNIDKQKHGCIQLRDFITTLVLLSEDGSREEKLHFIFQVFDNDSDGCLVYQIVT